MVSLVTALISFTASGLGLSGTSGADFLPQAPVAATAVSAANPAIAILILITSRCGRLLHLRR